MGCLPRPADPRRARHRAAWPGSGWFGLFAPHATPAPVVERLNRDFNEALAQPEVVEGLRRFGLRPEAVPPEALGRRIA